MSEDPARSFFGLFLLGFLGSFGSVVSPVLPKYAEQLGASYMEIGLFFSAYSLTWTSLQLYTGYLSDRYGRKRFVMLGLSIYGLSLILRLLPELYTARHLSGSSRCGAWALWTCRFRLGCSDEGEGKEFCPLPDREQLRPDAGTDYRRNCGKHKPLLPFLYGRSSIIVSCTLGFPRI